LNFATASKVKSIAEIKKILQELRGLGKKIVQCHGVFDLLHPGHVRHLQKAREQGDQLIVTVTPDRFVNKGPGRPAFNEELRIETLAALSQVDYVVLNDSPDAVNMIRRICPDVYVKGSEYREHTKDITGKIAEEARAVEEMGGTLYYTDDIVFSSSALINRYFDPPPTEVIHCIERIKNSYNLETILAQIEALSSMKVLVVGDAIIDEYQYVHPLGHAGKGLHATARCLEKEVFLGGALIIANHMAQFAGAVTLLTSIGESCPHRDFIAKTLDTKVESCFVQRKGAATLTKRRYVVNEGKHFLNLFETYSKAEHPLNEQETTFVIDTIKKNAKNYDLVLVCDFGNGFTNPRIVAELSTVPNFLALNTQTNGGNRGFNVVTHYARANFISLNELELRLAAHDCYSNLSKLIQKIAERLHCSYMSVTRGANGVLCYTKDQELLEIPAFTSSAIDRIGAGDCYFSLAALCLAKGYPHAFSGFIGSIAAAIDVQIVGNRAPVHKSDLIKYLTRLIK